MARTARSPSCVWGISSRGRPSGPISAPRSIGSTALDRQRAELMAEWGAYCMSGEEIAPIHLHRSKGWKGTPDAYIPPGADAALRAEMKRMIEAGEAPGKWQAALAVAGQALGVGSLESRAKRLAYGKPSRMTGQYELAIEPVAEPVAA
jgi:hypothetical protein